MAMAEIFDIAILGATAGGYAAAISLVERGLSVVVVEAPTQVAECRLCDWVGKDFFALKGLPKSLAEMSAAQRFKSVVYHGVALDKQARHSSRSGAGYFLHSDKLVAALRDTAIGAGASIRAAGASHHIIPGEHEVRIVDTDETCARILLLAGGLPGGAVELLGIQARNVPQSPLSAAGLDLPLDKGASAGGIDDALHVVESAQRAHLGMFFTLGDTLHLRSVSYSPALVAGAAELSEMAGRLSGCGLLPANLPMDMAKGAMWRPPGGVALELDTHVAKRSLLIATAGGFADAATGQTLAASVRSALLAADIAAEAVESDNCQDVLKRFEYSWRDALSHLLRQPGTPIQVLLPIALTNRKLAERVRDSITLSMAGLYPPTSCETTTATTKAGHIWIAFAGPGEVARFRYYRHQAALR
ncbi:MAG: hypothetical protein J7M14_02680 [Planctomycetes bacterium]|nr:hypothetical protein [Planctomycetota bacterium]